jgi:multiple sugar transport system permease protein
VTWLYKLAFRYGKLDIAAALSIVMFLILLLSTMLYVVLAMRNEREAA